MSSHSSQYQKGGRLPPTNKLGCFISGPKPNCKSRTVCSECIISKVVEEFPVRRPDARLEAALKCGIITKQELCIGFNLFPSESIKTSTRLVFII
jgi:hypothetical protein